MACDTITVFKTFPIVRIVKNTIEHNVWKPDLFPSSGEDLGDIYSVASLLKS
jgi:hypothetical protein